METTDDPKDLTSLATTLAATQHYGHYDKQGHPYILHPLRVMAGVTRTWEHMHPALRQELEDSGVTVNDLRAVAVLHDTLEDTGLLMTDVTKAGFPEHIGQALAAITRRYFRASETYPEFIERVKLDPIAVHIKLLDLQDNMNRGRGSMSKEEHEGLLRRYAKARAKLEAYLFERIEAKTEEWLLARDCTREQPHDGSCNGYPCPPVKARLKVVAK